MPFDEKSSKPPLDPGNKPRNGLSFFLSQDFSLGNGNTQDVSNKETATCKDYTTNFSVRLFQRDSI